MQLTMALSTSTTLFPIQSNRNPNYPFLQTLAKLPQTLPSNYPDSLCKPLTSSFNQLHVTAPAFSTSQEVGSMVDSESIASKLDKVRVFDLSGNGIPITDLWKDRKAVIAFARHFGCVFCRKRADYLASKKGEMDAVGAALVVIGPGSIDQLLTDFDSGHSKTISHTTMLGNVPTHSSLTQINNFKLDHTLL